MAEFDDMDIDPAIAEAMGFSGFGGKKRKQGATDQAFVDPALTKHAKSSQAPGKGSNNTPLGNRKGHSSSAGNAPDTMGSNGGEPAADPARFQTSNDSSLSRLRNGASSLEALRHGVKNERGDMVYFLPSFIEDPWKDLSVR